MPVCADGRETIRLTYEVEGDTHRLKLPQPTFASHADNLWKHTCFEAFVGTDESDAYQEFNFSPSSQWAHYSFASERVRSEDHSIPRISPKMQLACLPSKMTLVVHLPATNLPSTPAAWGLTAVMELDDGTLSYWALHHPAAQPDFHHPSARTLAWPQRTV